MSKKTFQTQKTFFIVLLLKVLFSFSQSLTLNIAENHFKIDHTNLLIVSHIDNIESYNDLSIYTNIILDLNQNEYNFNVLPNSLSYTESYLINSSTNQYALYFTELPIISIETQNIIIDEPKVHANFMYSDSEQILISDIGIELRGGSSQSYPKKTYDLEFWEDETGDDTQNVQFGNLRSDDDWILDALYNEPLRLRSYIANKLWLDIHTPHYIDSEAEAKAGADVKYVEMFLNDVYNGIYNISEQVDKKQLKLKSFNDNIRGELYKGVSWGASTYNSLPNYTNSSRLWSGYEIKYPKDDEITDWENLYEFTDFVINSSDENFIDNVWNTFNYDNYLDYFIFLNLLRATDNTGKNIYLAKYTTNESYFYIPWDLDGCFGTIWNGTNENITNDILINGFFDRVIALNPNGYSQDIASKWIDLRTHILEENNLINTFENQYQYLFDNKIYERESLIYQNYAFSEQDLTYMVDWIKNRLTYLDSYFDSFLSINETDLTETKLLLYPNPAKDKIYVTNLDLLKENNYKIHDMFGKLIDHGKISNNDILIEKLKTGFYIININNKAYKIIVN